MLAGYIKGSLIIHEFRWWSEQHSNEHIEHDFKTIAATIVFKTKTKHKNRGSKNMWN